MNIEHFKVITVDSMTGDCPQSWVDRWKREGYNAIHFIGNGCNDFTRMDQETPLNELEKESII